MNRIILIGNGFDLAHGLETSYKHFIDYFWKEEIKKIRENSKTEFAYPVLHMSNYEDDIIKIKDPQHQYVQLNTDKLFSNYDELKKNVKQSFLTIKNRFLEVISDRAFILQNWVDIENEYYKALKNIIHNDAVINIEYNSVKELNANLNDIKNAFVEYLKKEYKKKIKGIKETRNYYNLLTYIYLDFNIEDFIFHRENFKEKIIGENCNPKNMLFLNFNYTPIEGLYYGPNANKEAESIHIHGELFKEENPIVFGYGDELDDDYKSIERLNDNKFFENIKSIKYFETSNYKRLMNFIYSDYYQIFVFGHSCGISDRTLLNKLFEHENCASIKVYYHKKENGTDDYSNVIRNISRNFTDKSIMRERVVPKTNCIPLPQLKKIINHAL
jgi:hypothetical protein